MDSDQSGSKNTIEVKLKTCVPNSPRFKSGQISHGNELQFTSRRRQHKGIQLITKNIKDSPNNKEPATNFAQFEKDIEDELNNIIQMRFDIVKSKISSKRINQILAYFSKEWKKVKPATQPANGQNPQKVKYLLNQYQISEKYTHNRAANNGKMQIRQQIINLPIYEEEHSREGMALAQKITQLKIQNQKLSEEVRKTRKIRMDIQNDYRKLKADVVINVKNLQIKQTSLEEQILILTNQAQKLNDQIEKKERKLNAQIPQKLRQDYKIIIQKLQKQLELEKETRKNAQTTYNALKLKTETITNQANLNISPLKDNEVVISKEELLKLTILKNSYEKMQVQNEFLANSKQYLRQRLQEYQTLQNDLRKQTQKLHTDKLILEQSLNSQIQKLVEQINAIKQNKEEEFNFQQQNIMELQDKNTIFKSKLQNSINQMNAKSESYEQQIIQANHSIDQLNQKIKQYQQSVIEKDNKNKQLQLQLQRLKIKDQPPININGIQLNQTQIDNEVINLTNRLKYQEEQVEAYKKTIQDKQQHLQRLLADIEVLNRQNRQLSNSKQQLNLQYHIIKAKIQSVQQQNEKIKVEKQKQTQDINIEKRQFQQQKEEHERKINSFQQKHAELVQQIQQLKAARLTDLQKEKQIDLTNNQQFKQDSEIIKSKEISFNIERQRLNEQIKFLQDQMVLKQTKLVQQKQNYSTLKKQYNLIYVKYTECEQKIGSLVQNLLQKDTEISLLEERLSTISEKEKTLMTQALQNEKQKQKKDNMYNFQKAALQSKLNNKLLEISELNIQIQNLNETLKESTILNSELSEQIQKNRQIIYSQMASHQQNSRFTTVIQEKDVEIHKLQGKVQERQMEIDQISRKLNNANQIDIHVKEMQKTLDQKINLVLHLQNQIKRLNSQFQQNLQQSHEQIQKKETAIEHLKAKLVYLQGISKETDKIVHSLFQNQVLAGHIEHKKYLKQIIEQRTKLHLIRTKLIYAFDPLNLTNFHKYIDEKSAIVVVIKMVNGNFLAAYCQGQFNKKKASNQDGLIVSLTNRQHFVLVQKGRRPITYDDYYLIFGNSEVRLRSNEKIIFSNFGISNGYYASRGKNVSVLLGGSPQQRQLQMEHFEVYQLIMAE